MPKEIPSEEEMEAILFGPDMGTPTGLRNRALLELLYGTGIRRFEAADLDLYDVNLAESTVTIRNGKGAKGRTVPLGTSAVHFLTRYMKEARPKMIPLEEEDPRNRSWALFVVPGGDRLSKDRLGWVVGRYVRAVKPTATRTCHGIRHAFATHMLRGGADLARIQRMLGHEKISATEIYTHVTTADMKEEHRRCHPRGIMARDKRNGGVAVQ